MARAVVIGASIAGMLAAAVLTEFYDEVVAFDRDPLPDEPEARPGVPQSLQLHTLQARGVQVLDELLPGFRNDLLEAGAVTGDAQADARWYLDDYLLMPAQSDVECIALTRPVLEWLLRARGAGLRGVRIIDGTEVTGLVVRNGQVTGVRTQGKTAQGTETTYADLVIDASGGESRIPVWLRESGCPVPETSSVNVGVTCVSRLYTAAAGQLDGRFAETVLPYLGKPRGGTVLRQEGDRFIVALAGMAGEDVPVDDEGMLAFADSLASPDLASVLRESEPVGDPVMSSYPTSAWRRYEELVIFVGGFLAIGDAVCGLNPIHGQGITVAALEALKLREILRETSSDAMAGVPERYFREIGKVISGVWSSSAALTRGIGPVNTYLRRYRAAASVDPVLARTFLRVANMIDSPLRMAWPDHMLRVARAAPAARAAMAASASAEPSVA